MLCLSEPGQEIEINQDSKAHMGYGRSLQGQGTQISEEQLLRQSCWCMGQLEPALLSLVRSKKSSFVGNGGWWLLPCVCSRPGLGQ